MTPVSLDDVAARIGAASPGGGTAAISGMTHDSRQVGAGVLFACVPGENVDGHDFAADAVAKQAAALLVERLLPLDVPQLVVPSVRAAMGPAACTIFGDPSTKMSVMGVTGTSGKTTVTQLLEGILREAGRRPATVGTLTGTRTTPEAPELQASLAEMADRGVGSVAMEVSSHALELHRVDGTRFRAAAFTNLGHDHLDFHGDMASYQRAKARLFTAEFTHHAVINLDDPAGAEIATQIRADQEVELIGYGLVDARNLIVDGPTNRFEWRGHEVVLRLAGPHNVSNALAAALLAEIDGVETADIAEGLCRADAPRGRFEFVAVGQDFHVVVDYAHKPEALVAVLAAARQVVPDHRVILVIGAGGDRDRDKRPMMGRVAVTDADHVVVTSDNPRSEDPDAIIADIMRGATEAPAGRATGSIDLVPDRDAAIGRAISAANPGDLVLIAGKGHETYQEIDGVQHPFDDRAVAIEWLLAGGRS